MGGSLSVRFGAVLPEEERDALSAACGSSGATIASWRLSPSTHTTYARVDYHDGSPAAEIARRFPAARIDDPPLVVLDIAVPSAAERQRLVSAVDGAAAPVGVVAVMATPDGVLVELDDTRTPLGLLVDLIDAEVGGASPAIRSIRPLIPLSDRTLARLAGASLSAPEVDETRLIETYSEPLMRAPQ